MSRTIFVTATDTDAGKTWVTASLLQSCLAQGLDIQALKPIASGINDDGVNDDVAILLSEQTSKRVEDINYITFDLPLAPALAAKKQNINLSKDALLSWQDAQIAKHDVTLIEGVGGLMVPLQTDDKPWLVSDWLRTMNDVEVMLVVPLRLGCINQALLSCEHLQKIGSPPKWLVLNDISGNNTFNDTREMLLAVLQQACETMPHIIHLAHSGEMPTTL